MGRHHRTREDDKRYNKSRRTQETKQRLARREAELPKAKRNLELARKNNPGYSFAEKLRVADAENDVEFLERGIQEDLYTLKFNKGEMWSTLAGILVFGTTGLIVLLFIVIFFNDIFG